MYVRSSTFLPGECFGSVKKLCFTDDSVPAAIVSVFEPTGEDVVPKPRYHSLLREDDEDDFKATKIFEVVYIQSQKVIYNKSVSAEDIIQKCIHIPVKYSPTDFISILPNNIEHH